MALMRAIMIIKAATMKNSNYENNNENNDKREIPGLLN